MIETIVVSAVIFGIYAIFGQFVTASWSAGAIAAMLASSAFVLFLMGRKPRAMELIKKAGAFALLCALIIGFSKLNDHIAKVRGVWLAAACEAYKAKTGAYPQTLRSLVPEYIADIPRAKYTLLWGNFIYFGTKIVYVYEPFLATPAYDLAAAEWGYVPPLKMFDPRPGALTNPK